MFYIENIRKDDPNGIDKIVGYLANNPHEGIRTRPRHLVDIAINTGTAVVVKKNNRICGCSMIYEYYDNHTGPLFKEIGTMRITENGYDLQSFIFCFHILQLVSEDFYCSYNYDTFSVVEEGTASEHNLKTKLGMKRYTPPETLIRIRERNEMPFSNHKYAIKVDEQVISNILSKLNKFYKKDNVFCTPKGSKDIHINMDWFTPEILKIDDHL